MRLAILTLAALLVGCGGSDGPPSGMTGSAGTGGPAGGGTMTWKENGAARSSSFGSASRVKSASSDMLQIVGSDTSGNAIAFGVVVMTPPLGPASFNCGGGGYPIVTMTYTAGSASSTIATACSIEITSVGDDMGSHAVGTFSGTLPLDNGTTKTITDGKFDLAQQVRSL
jgi:hypothetical protein